MIITLVGYMGSGKSHVAKVLSQKLQLKIIDLDREISLKNKMTIPEIFAKKGEIYFRKQERETLHQLLNTHSAGILSLGGGTPCFYDNMETINQLTESFFLRASVGTLVTRLSSQMDKRPLIAHLNPEDLPEFIAKHLFERNVYYSKAKFTITTDGKNPEQVADEIWALV